MFGNQALVVSDSFSNLFKSSWNWASDQYGKWSNYFYEAQDSVQNPQEYFPQDIQSQMYSEIHFQEAIQTIENHFEERNLQPVAWKATLEFYLDEVKAGRLSLLSFHRGIESILEQSKELFDKNDNLFQRFYDHAKNEIQAKLKDNTNLENKTWIQKQFRFSIYQGLQDVLNQKMTKEEWLEELESYADLVDTEFYETIQELSQKICNNIQEKDLLNQITQQELIHYVSDVEASRHSRKSGNLPKEKQVVAWMSEAKSRDLDNSKLRSIQKAFNWIWDHKAEAFTFGIAATAIYKSTQTQTENNFAPINTLAKFAMAFGTQQILNSRTGGISNPILPTLFSFGVVQAQATFIDIMGGNYNDYGWNVKNTTDGYVVVGITNSFGTGNNSDIFFLKYWGNDSLASIQKLNAPGNESILDIQIDAQDEIFITGSTTGIFGGLDVFLTRLNLDTGVVWSKAIGKSFDDQGWSLQLTTANEVILAGYTYVVGSGNKVFLTNWDYNGNLQWVNTFGGTGDNGATSVKVNAANEIFIGGWWNTPTNSWDFLLSKWTSNGTFVWGNSWGGSGQDSTHALEFSPQGDIYVVGDWISNLGDSDIFTSRWSSINGSLLAGRLLGTSNNDWVDAAALTPQGDLVIAAINVVKVFGNNNTLAWTRTWNHPWAPIGIYVNPQSELLISGQSGCVTSINDQSCDAAFLKLNSQGQLPNCQVIQNTNFTINSDITSLVNVTRLNSSYVGTWSPSIISWNVSLSNFTFNYIRECSTNIWETNLALYLPFNGDTLDYSGNNWHGTGFNTTFAPGKFGQAISCNGINAYVKGASDGLPTRERTIAFWFNAVRVDNAPGLFGYGGVGCSTSFFMSLNLPVSSGAVPVNNTYEIQGHCGGHEMYYAYSNSTTIQPIIGWNHWVVRTDSNGTCFFINGQNVKCNADFINDTSVNGKNYGVCVVASPNGTVPYTDGNLQYFNGLVDELLIYNISLNDAQIQYLYQSGPLLSPPPTPEPTPNPTPFPTPLAASSTPVSSSSQPTSSHSSSKGGATTIPIAIGAAIGGLVVLGAGIGGAVWFFKKRKEKKILEPQAKSENVELVQQKSGSAPKQTDGNQYLSLPRLPDSGRPKSVTQNDYAVAPFVPGDAENNPGKQYDFTPDLKSKPGQTFFANSQSTNDSSSTLPNTIYQSPQLPELTLPPVYPEAAKNTLVP